MTAGDVLAYYAEEKLKQWLAYSFKKPGGRRSRMMVGIFVDPKNYVVIPMSFKSFVEMNWCPLFQASLN